MCYNQAIIKLYVYNAPHCINNEALRNSILFTDNDFTRLQGKKNKFTD